MNRPASSAPLRFLATVGLLWIGGRLLIAYPGDVSDRLEEVASAIVEPAEADVRDALRPVPMTAMAVSVPVGEAAAPDRPPAGGPVRRLAAVLPPPAAAAAPAAIASAPVAAPSPVADLPVTAAAGGQAPPALSPSRWSVQAYLFARSGGEGSLASGGQLGGGQMGVRVVRQLAEVPSIAIAGRLSSPLEGVGAEASAGVDWHPTGAKSLRLSIERRIALDGGGRNAWSAYGAGGFWRPLGHGVAVDGYAQAGIVGARRRDGFVDGAIRVVRAEAIGPSAALHWGGGIWGGAQPGVSRLDAGPRVAVVVPIAGKSVSAAIEGRLRVAGDAAPGSGAAFTLATDF